MKFPGLKGKPSIPKYLEGREKLTKEQFAKKYFPDDEKRMKIVIELWENLEKFYNINLTGLHPNDRLWYILGEPKEDGEDTTEYETVASMLEKSIKKYVINYIYFKPFENHLKQSKWHKESIRYRSFGQIVNEVAKYKK